MPTYFVRCGDQRLTLEARDRKQAAIAALKLLAAQRVPLGPWLFVSRRSYICWATPHRVDTLAQTHGIELPEVAR